MYVYSDEDTLRQPVLSTNRRNVLIEQVEIDMDPSIVMFEEELCRLINKDRMEKKRIAQTTVTGLVQDTNNKVSIVERRLRVYYLLGIQGQIYEVIFDLGGCA